MMRELRRAYANGMALEEMREVLVAGKARGVSRAAMERALEAWRREVAGAEEDRILELLDYVVGWCPSAKKLWP
ncbi:MAG: hypothetical protein H6722_10975 [Sandaracinus sp.]|jgi:hypothetical protein|nr:hypothetical protein [Sandaracinus sp.]MCB9619108.1 hypothetical protein [Sandaracinus sp.]